MKETAAFGEQELAPGLSGYTVEFEDSIYVPLLIADEPGNGALTRYLDKLEQGPKTIKIPNVLSGRLARYLQRRGYQLRWEYSKQYGEDVDVWTRLGNKKIT